MENAEKQTVQYVDAPIALLIPALDPGPKLLNLLDELDGRWQGPIVLVDDGSGTEPKQSVFAAAQKRGCIVVVHAVNMGKGRALKTGFNECLLRWPQLAGVVTADADGQHTPEDICSCAEALRSSPKSLIMGCRCFDGDQVPLRSRLGNRITRTVMRVLCGVRVSDTQTGLRGIPADFMRELLTLAGERFEFETNMLLETSARNIPIREVTIQTVYEDKNSGSHFNPLIDSLRIYALFLKFIASSLAGSVVDLAAFALLFPVLPALVPVPWRIAAATAAARVLSAVVNYLCNRKLVFRSERTLGQSAVRYGCLCILQLCASAGLVTVLSKLIPIPVVLVKALVDTLLFFVSFQLQRGWVFLGKK